MPHRHYSALSVAFWPPVRLFAHQLRQVSSLLVMPCRSTNSLCRQQRVGLQTSPQWRRMQETSKDSFVEGVRKRMKTGLVVSSVSVLAAVRSELPVDNFILFSLLERLPSTKWIKTKRSMQSMTEFRWSMQGNASGKVCSRLTSGTIHSILEGELVQFAQLLLWHSSKKNHQKWLVPINLKSFWRTIGTA